MKIIIQCAWCHKCMGVKESSRPQREKLNVSHSICPACLKKIIDEYHGAANRSQGAACTT